MLDEAKSVLGGGCGTNASSKKLRENLLSSGKLEPAYKNAAHHIVACSSPKAAEARAILKKYNIDINAADNGVFYLLKEEVLMQHTILVYTRMNIIEK